MNDIPEQPCGYYVLVEMDKFEEKSAGGIILATVAEGKRENGGMTTGTIKAFGPSAYKGFPGCNGPDDWGVKIGDRFRTHRYAGDPISVDDVNKEHWRLIEDSAIKSIIRGGKDGE